MTLPELDAQIAAAREAVIAADTLLNALQAQRAARVKANRDAELDALIAGYPPEVLAALKQPTPDIDDSRRLSSRRLQEVTTWTDRGGRRTRREWSSLGREIRHRLHERSQ